MTVILLPIYTNISPSPVLVCKYLTANAFEYPFFDEGVRECQKPQRHAEITDPNILPKEDLLSISGFIFHTSHCGSTLLSRMIGTSERVRIVSEPEAVNGLLLAYLFYDLPREQVLKWLKQIIVLFQQKAEASETHLIFKFSSWNVLFIDFFQELWEEVPTLYIDRKEEEVIRSLLKSGNGFVGWWDHPGRVLIKKILDDEKGLSSREEYLQRMIELKRKAASDRGKKQTTSFLNYHELIEVFEDKVLSHFGLQFSEEEINRAMALTKYYSKSKKAVPFKK